MTRFSLYSRIDKGMQNLVLKIRVLKNPCTHFYSSERLSVLGRAGNGKRVMKGLLMVACERFKELE